MLSIPEIQDAAARISTFHIKSIMRPALFKHYGPCDIHFKCEHEQVTGAFKVRGALNYALMLNDDAQPLIAASTGNHGAAVAYAARCIGRSARIYMPHTTSFRRRTRIEKLGASVVLVGRDCLEAELAARKEATKGIGVYISPYNDRRVIQGQATLGLEIFEQMPELTHVFVAVGGGGLIAGIGSALKALKPSLHVIGCSPQNSDTMARSVRAGRICEWHDVPTLSTSTAGGLESPSETLVICQDVVDTWIDVSETEIRLAMQGLEDDELIFVEGAAAVADAAARKYCPTLPKDAVCCIVLCGANR